MIDSKEKLSNCLKLEKELYFPGGTDSRSVLGKKISSMDTYVI